MSKDLISLAGDLVSERKRLSESLQRLEGLLTRREITAELFRILGVKNGEQMLAEFESLARGLDRLGSLTKTLVQSVNYERLETCEPLLADAVLSVETVSSNLSRPVVVDCKSNEVRIDRDTLQRFRPIFLEMLETMVEYCVESPKERLARKKRPKAYFQIDIKPLEGGYRLMVLCDGNGILPPLVGDHGYRLAEIGVRAGFEGKPGQWSAWKFHIPTGIGAFQSVPVLIGNRRLCVPEWAVQSCSRVSAAQAKSYSQKKIWMLNENLERELVDLAEMLATGNRTVIEIAAGTHSATYVVDQVFEAESGFMKPLGDLFNGRGRFLGVVASESSPSTDENNAGIREELHLVLSPAYLVYGSLIESRPGENAASAMSGKPPSAGVKSGKGENHAF